VISAAFVEVGSLRVLVSSLFSPWNPQNLSQSFLFKSAERVSYLPSSESDSHIRTLRLAVGLLPLLPLYRRYNRPIMTVPQFRDRMLIYTPCLVLRSSWYIYSFVINNPRYGQKVSCRIQITRLHQCYIFGLIFGDFDWPLNASRGLSSIAEFLVKTRLFFILYNSFILYISRHGSAEAGNWTYDLLIASPLVQRPNHYATEPQIKCKTLRIYTLIHLFFRD